MLTRSAGLLALLYLATTACAADNQLPKDVAAILDKAESIEFLSLSPKRGEKDIPEKDNFHGFRILGRVTLKDAGRKTIVDGLRKGIKDSDGSVAACFNPRHGIRATVAGKTADIVICFECHSLVTHIGETRGSALTARTPEATFNKVLKDANVPLPPQRD